MPNLQNFIVTPEFDKRFLAMARLEPRCRSEESLQRGLEARTADPLWFLARQWQMGEFQAEDCGSPVRVEVCYACEKLDNLGFNRPDGAMPQGSTGQTNLAPLFKLTPTALEILKVAGLPEDILGALKRRLAGRAITGEKGFIYWLKQAIVDQDIAQYRDIAQQKELILRHALFAAQVPPVFKLTPTALENLKRAGLPENILVILRRLTEQAITGENEFIDRLKQMMDAQTIARHRELILRYALFTAQKPPVFKLTPAVLEILRQAGLPQDILDVLRRLEGQVITGENQFINRLKEAMGDQAIERYGELLLQHTLIAAPPPLETLVERERVPLDWRMRVQMGQQFERFLRRDLGSQQNSDYVIAYYRQKIGIRLAEVNWTMLDDATERFLRFMQGRVIDGLQALQAVTPAALPALPNPLPEGISIDMDILTDSLEQAINRFQKWYAELYSQPGSAEETYWKPRELEYEFNLQQTCAAAGSATEQERKTILVAPDYRNGDLDWYTCDLQQPGKGEITKNLRTAWFNPTRLGFPGKPNERWWAFEDANVDLGKLMPNTTELSKLLLMEFALLYADDWYQVPLELPRGSLTKITELKIHNVFGETFGIDPAIDGGETGTVRWEMFTQADHKNPEQTSAAFLFIPPTLGDREESPPVEEVRFLRDEGANMVFAVEHLARNGLGKPVAGYDLQTERRTRLRKHLQEWLRNVQWALTQSGLSNEMREFLLEREKTLQARLRNMGMEIGTPDTKNAELLRYRLASTVPDNWIPYIPVRITEDRAAKFGRDPYAICLRRARMVRNDAVENPVPEFVTPLTRILHNPEDTAKSLVWLNEEAVPRAGTKVQITRQRMRWIDGKTYTWWGRTVKTGRGEGSSGLIFDKILQ